MGTNGLFKAGSSIKDSHEILLSFKKWGVTFKSSSSSIIFVSSLFNKIFLFSSFLFLSLWINGEFEIVFWDNFEPFVEGSISSFELSGIIILRLFFFCCKFSTLSSIFSSFISLISFIFGGIIKILFVGLISFGCSFWEDLSWPILSSKKSLGKIFLLNIFMFDRLYILIEMIKYLIKCITSFYRSLVEF